MARPPRRHAFSADALTVRTTQEAAIESALKNKLEAKKKAREAAAAAAQREIAEFTAHFMEAAQRCFELIDKDDSGTLTKEEIVVAVKSDKEVIDFLKTCGEPNLVALTQPARLSKALDMLDTSKDGEMDMDEWMAAIKRGLAKRLDELADERERRERAGGGGRRGVQRRVPEHGPQGLRIVLLLVFAASGGRDPHTIFDMIDADGGGTLSKAEIVDAVKNNDEVIKFLSNCGNENLRVAARAVRLEHVLRHGLGPARSRRPSGALQSETLVCLRRGDGVLVAAGELRLSPRPQIDGASRPTGLWEAAIEQALKAKIEQRRAAREAQAAADRRELEAFKEQFLNAAREVFALIDADGNGSLTKTEIVDAVTSDKKVISFLGSCGEPNLQFLLQPKRLEKALKVLDTSQDGEIDADECAFSASYLSFAIDATPLDGVANTRTHSTAHWFLRREAAIYRGLEEAHGGPEGRAGAARQGGGRGRRGVLGRVPVCARKVFEMIDVDNSGTLTKQEIITAVKENKEVKMFLANCGNENLQYLLVPSRLNHALSVLDKDGDDEIDANEWCVSRSPKPGGLSTRLTGCKTPRHARTPSPRPSRRSSSSGARCARRTPQAFRREIEEFTANFLNAAREAFALIDKDDSRKFVRSGLCVAVRGDRPVIDFLRNCGEENLQFLLQPARLEKALAQLDTDNSGEVDIDECPGERRLVSVSRVTPSTRRLLDGVARFSHGRAPDGRSRVDSRTGEEGDLPRPGQTRRAAPGRAGASRMRAAAAADEEFSAEFLTMARAVFDMIDKDQSGTLTKKEIVDAVAASREGAFDIAGSS